MIAYQDVGFLRASFFEIPVFGVIWNRNLNGQITSYVMGM